MINFSYWEESVFIKDIDFAIIGAGITGLSAAISLREKEPNARIVILERAFLPTGASTRNAGFACFGSMTELLSDLKLMGDETWSLVENRWKGLQLLRNRVGDKGLEYHGFGGYELFLEDDQTFQKSKEYLPIVNQELQKITGISNVFQEDTASSFGMQGVKHMIFNQAEGQINPAKMIQSLLKIATKKDISIFWGTNVTGWESDSHGIKLELNNQRIQNVGKVIVAVNGFAKRLFPEIALEPARNLVLVTSPIKDLALKGTFHYDEGYYYFRNIGDRVLLGGGRKLDPKNETTSEFGLNEQIQHSLEHMLKTTILPSHEYSITHQWSGIMGVGESKTPILKRHGEHIVIAVRLGGMGVALGSQLGHDAAELLINPS